MTYLQREHDEGRLPEPNATELAACAAEAIALAKCARVMVRKLKTLKERMRKNLGATAEAPVFFTEDRAGSARSLCEIEAALGDIVDNAKYIVIKKRGGAPVKRPNHKRMSC